MPVHLAELWVDVPRALMLVFVRQYGCPLCRAQVESLGRMRDEFAAAGVDVAIIGQGTPAEATRFRDEMHLPFPVFSDDSRSAFATYGLQDGSLEQVFGLTPGRPFLRAMLRGHLPGRTVGSVRQLPGTFVIDRDGIVRMAHPGANAADVPDVSQLLARIVATMPLPTS
jgi:peroxiredoxin